MSLSPVAKLPKPFLVAYRDVSQLERFLLKCKLTLSDCYPVRTDEALIHKTTNQVLVTLPGWQHAPGSEAARDWTGGRIIITPAECGERKRK